MNKIVWALCLLIISLPSIADAQTCGTTNIAYHQPVVVPTEWVYGLGSGAVDGDRAHGWYTAPSDMRDTSFLYVDLTQSYTICTVKIFWEVNGRGKNYQVQTSTDAVNWTTLFTRTNNSSQSDSFNVVGTGRYVRVYMTARVNSWANYQLAEIEIYNTLSNSKPRVSLTAPVNNFSTIAATNLKLAATATDIDGSISKVEFYQDSLKLGEVTSAPYEYTVTNIQPGSFNFRAKAFDNTNADSLSAPIHVTVTPSNRWLLNGNSGTNPDSTFVGTTDNKKLVFKVNNSKKMVIQPNGFVGIGIESISDSTAKLGVEGTIYARKIKVTQDSWADYVFEDDYQLMSLPELAAFIRKHKHLPEMPTTLEVKAKGTDVAQMQELLLRKVEELTLYILQQGEQLKEQRQKIEALEKQVKEGRK